MYIDFVVDARGISYYVVVIENGMTAMIHAQHNRMLVEVAQCHTVNVSRVSMKVVSREAFAKLRPDWQCNRCKKAIEKEG